MNGKHGSQDDLLERIHGFVVAGESNELGDERWRDFERLLLENDDACRLYAEYMDMSIFLPAMLDMVPEEERLSVGTMAPEPQPTIFPWTPLFGGDVAHSAASYFSSGWPVAYLAATVVFGIGLLIGSLMPASHPQQTATHSSSPSQPVAEAKTDVIGRITGMVDCMWERPEGGGQGSDIPNSQSLIPNPQSQVSLGDRFALRSGLLEITYDTGAKVILQGPVTYETDSTVGGYLSVGKLTVRLEKGGERREERGERTPNLQISKSPNPSLSALSSSLFTIKTPTATVTDLGTEFGVEVYKNGNAEVHVLRGAVDVGARQGGRHWRLQADDDGSNNAKAARIEAQSGENGGAKIVFVTPEPHRFLRALPGPTTAKHGERILVGSRFNRSTEGWTVNLPAGTEVLYARDGGNPGGCIQTQEGMGPEFFYFIAPPEYGGDRSAAFGGQLQFDVFTTIFLSTPDVPETMAMEPPLVILQGRDCRIAADQSQRVERDKWSPLTVPLSAAGKWYRLAETGALEGKQTDRTPVADAVIRAVLADLREVWIRAEYMHGRDLGRLDNVLLVTPAEAAEKAESEPRTHATLTSSSSRSDRDAGQ